MISSLHVPKNLMETVKRRSSLHGCVAMFIFFAMVITGSEFEAPSSPQCFRRNADESVYICEWRVNTSESRGTYDLYFNDRSNPKYVNIQKTWAQINEEELIKYRPVEVWVVARVGHSNYSSPRTSVILADTIKYEVPQNISVSWLKNNLSLTWTAAEKHPALAEVWFRKHARGTESWEKRSSRTSRTPAENMYQFVVGNLLKNQAYQIRMRHRSVTARNPLWSDWSPVVIAPTKLEHKPEVTVTTELGGDVRRVTLKWRLTQPAEAVQGVTYILRYSHECPCKGKIKQQHINATQYTIYVTHSAVNISVTARNTAGNSPPAVIQVPAVPTADLHGCDKTFLDGKLQKRTCHELYELQDEDLVPHNVIHLTTRKKELQDGVRYLHAKHVCVTGNPKKVKRCFFYKKQDVPDKEPQDFIAFSDTHTSANLSWRAIPIVHQRGFLSHYRLCSVKIGSAYQEKECRNISASLINYRLESLTPGVKYNISLAGVTQAGEGPKAMNTVQTSADTHGKVWLTLGLLLVIFVISVKCTFIFKRLKKKLFPPVPTPVIFDFPPHQSEIQEMLREEVEEEEEVHELTLHQLHPVGKSLPEDTEETAVYPGECEDSPDEEAETGGGGTERSSDECSSAGSTEEALEASRKEEMTDMEQVNNQLALLLYRKGLVFDMKTDST